MSFAIKKLLIFAGVSEIGFGLLLLLLTKPTTRWLLAVSVSGTALFVARVAGACLIVLGLVCWPRGDSRLACYLMLAWSVLAACSLVVVGIVWSAGVLLWPAAVVHSAVAILLWINRQQRDLQVDIGPTT